MRIRNAPSALARSPVYAAGGQIVYDEPKSKASRRTVGLALSAGILAEHVDDRAADPEAFDFVTSTGQRLRHGNFCNRILCLTRSRGHGFSAFLG